MIKRLLLILIYIIGGIEIVILSSPILILSLLIWIVTGKDKFIDIIEKSINWLDYLEQLLSKDKKETNLK